MGVLKNKRHEAFAAAHANGKSATDAYKLVYGVKKDHVAAAAASRLMTNVKIRERVEEIQKRITDRVVDETVDITKLNRAWLIQQAMELVHLAKAEKQLNAANRALELLGREFKTFIDKKHITVRTLAEMEDDELSELVSEYESHAGDEGEAGARRPH